ncbi:unnamed protein product [Closterium sp. NIES-53]
MANTPHVPLPPPIDASSVDKLQLAADRSAINWHSFVGSIRRVLQDAFVRPYCILDVLLRRPQALQPIAPNHPGETPPLPPRPCPPPGPNLTVAATPKLQAAADATFVHNRREYFIRKADHDVALLNYEFASSERSTRLELIEEYNTSMAAYIHHMLFNLTPDYESRLHAFTEANPLAVLPEVTQWIIDTEVKLCTPIVNLTTPHSSSASLNSTQSRTQGGRNGGSGVVEGVEVAIGVVLVVAVVVEVVVVVLCYPSPLPHGHSNLPLLPPCSPPSTHPFPPPLAPAVSAALLPAAAAAAVSSAAAAAAFSAAAAPTAAVLPAAAAAAVVPSAAVGYPVSPPPPSSPTLDLVLDSGATETALKDAGNLTPLPLPTQVHGADSSFSIPCTHLSTLPCTAFPSGKVIGLHIPTLRNNLLSHRELQGVGIIAIYPGFANYCDLYKTSSGRFLLRIPLCPRTRLYTLRTPRPSFCHVTTHVGTSTGPPPPLPPPHVSPSPASLPSSLPTSSSTPSPSSSTTLSHPAVILHHSLGHPNFSALRTTITSRLLHSLPPTLPPLLSSPAPPCPSCIHGKLKQSSHHSHPTFAAAPIALVHMDLWGPYPIRSRQGHRPGAVVVINWAEQCRNHFKRPIGHLHSDGGGEFINNTFATFCTLHGIQQTSTLPHSPQQNGIAESRIREITKIARCLIARASTPPSLWSYALLHAALLLNLCSHPQHPSSSPTELWSKAKPDAAGLRVWGCKSFVLIPPADRSHVIGKLAPHALECIYLGHNRDSPGYLFLHPPTNRLIRSIDVVFDESIPYYSTPPPDPLPPPSRPLAWTDTVLPPLLPPVAAPLPPSSSADVYDPAAPASPAHSAAPPPPSPSSSHSPPSLQLPGQQQQQQQQQQRQPGQQQGQEQQLLPQRQ